MDVMEAIRTTRAMRRLDPDKPVSDDDLRAIVEAATKGPTGGNTQPVRWLVITDADLRAKLGEIYFGCWEQAKPMYQANPALGDTPVFRSADHLGRHMGDAPALIMPCARGEYAQLSASVYGCVQNLFLAARALGLGTTLTTLHRMRETEVRDLLAIPGDVATFALIPVGHPLGTWGEAKRRPVEDTTYWNKWKERPPFAPI